MIGVRPNNWCSYSCAAHFALRPRSRTSGRIPLAFQAYQANAVRSAPFRLVCQAGRACRRKVDLLAEDSALRLRPGCSFQHVAKEATIGVEVGRVQQIFGLGANCSARRGSSTSCSSNSVSSLMRQVLPLCMA